MADGICARDLMRTDFLRIRTDQTLGDANTLEHATKRISLRCRPIELEQRFDVARRGQRVF